MSDYTIVTTRDSYYLNKDWYKEERSNHVRRREAVYEGFLAKMKSQNVLYVIEQEEQNHKQAIEWYYNKQIPCELLETWDFFHGLSVLAIIFLTMPVSYVPAKLLWSLAGHIQHTGNACFDTSIEHRQLNCQNLLF